MRLLLTSVLAAMTLPVMAEGSHHSASQQDTSYAGQETRRIKSLSDEDIAELRRGGGWGLAKAAELNGIPGPAHLLELKDEIPLRPDQTAKIEAIYEDMRAQAIAEGKRLIAREEALEDAFRSHTIDEASLRRLLTEIGESRTKLRFIHLSTHLTTPSLLSEGQISRYVELRGYGNDSCDAVPNGHDAALWRKHNNCN